MEPIMDWSFLNQPASQGSAPQVGNPADSRVESVGQDPHAENSLLPSLAEAELHNGAGAQDLNAEDVVVVAMPEAEAYIKLTDNIEAGLSVEEMCELLCSMPGHDSNAEDILGHAVPETQVDCGLAGQDMNSGDIPASAVAEVEGHSGYNRHVGQDLMAENTFVPTTAEAEVQSGQVKFSVPASLDQPSNGSVVQVAEIPSLPALEQPVLQSTDLTDPARNDMFRLLDEVEKSSAQPVDHKDDILHKIRSRRKEPRKTALIPYSSSPAVGRKRGAGPVINASSGSSRLQKILEKNSLTSEVGPVQAKDSQTQESLPSSHGEKRIRGRAPKKCQVKDPGSRQPAALKSSGAVSLLPQSNDSISVVPSCQSFSLLPASAEGKTKPIIFSARDRKRDCLVSMKNELTFKLPISGLDKPMSVVALPAQSACQPQMGTVGSGVMKTMLPLNLKPIVVDVPQTVVVKNEQSSQAAGNKGLPSELVSAATANSISQTGSEGKSHTVVKQSPQPTALTTWPDQHSARNRAIKPEAHEQSHISVKENQKLPTGTAQPDQKSAENAASANINEDDGLCIIVRNGDGLPPQVRESILDHDYLEDCPRRVLVEIDELDASPIRSEVRKPVHRTQTPPENNLSGLATSQPADRVTGSKSDLIQLSSAEEPPAKMMKMDQPAVLKKVQTVSFNIDSNSPARPSSASGMTPPQRTQHSVLQKNPVGAVSQPSEGPFPYVNKALSKVPIRNDQPEKDLSRPKQNSFTSHKKNQSQARQTNQLSDKPARHHKIKQTKTGSATSVLEQPQTSMLVDTSTNRCLGFNVPLPEDQSSGSPTSLTEHNEAGKQALTETALAVQKTLEKLMKMTQEQNSRTKSVTGPVDKTPESNSEHQVSSIGNSLKQDIPAAESGNSVLPSFSSTCQDKPQADSMQKSSTSILPINQNKDVNPPQNENRHSDSNRKNEQPITSSSATSAPVKSMIEAGKCEKSAIKTSSPVSEVVPSEYSSTKADSGCLPTSLVPDFESCRGEIQDSVAVSSVWEIQNTQLCERTATPDWTGSSPNLSGSACVGEQGASEQETDSPLISEAHHDFMGNGYKANEFTDSWEEIQEDALSRLTPSTVLSSNPRGPETGVRPFSSVQSNPLQSSFQPSTNLLQERKCMNRNTGSELPQTAESRCISKLPGYIGPSNPSIQRQSGRKELRAKDIENMYSNDFLPLDQPSVENVSVSGFNKLPSYATNPTNSTLFDSDHVFRDLGGSVTGSSSRTVALDSTSSPPRYSEAVSGQPSKSPKISSPRSRNSRRPKNAPGSPRSSKSRSRSTSVRQCRRLSSDGSSSPSSNASTPSSHRSSRRSRYDYDYEPRSRDYRYSRDREQDRRSYDRNRRRIHNMRKRKIVYVGGIPRGYTRRELRERFECYGRIEEVSVHFREDQDNYGFVTYHSHEEAQTAIEMGSKDSRMPFQLSYGGRREFCDDEYADLDANMVIREEYHPLPPRQQGSFEDLLHQYARLRK